VKKILIIRFSSFGDIIHARSLCKVLKESIGFEEIDWLVRSDLKGALEGEEYLNEIISFERNLGLGGLVRLAWSLGKRDYDVVYDAHNNIRSFVVRMVLMFFSSSKVVTRSKERIKRVLLFTFRINLFPKPYKAMESYWAPLKTFFNSGTTLKPIEWPLDPPSYLSKDLKEAIVLVPSTAWPMKSWPKEHWEELVRLLPNENFIILGGPEDIFCEEIKRVDPERITNLAGKLNLKESCAVAANARFIISADTGLQQVADLAGVNGLSLMGPSAFGFTTMGKMKTLEVSLSCRPCSKDGRGQCSQSVFQKCMVDITPRRVAREVSLFLRQ